MVRTQSNRGAANRGRSGGKSGSGSKNEGSFFGALKDKPYAAAGVAAGVAAAGAFLWSKRSQIGDAIDSGMEKLDELKADRFGSEESQADISEEALTLKETGSKAKPKTTNQEAKASTKAFS